MDMSLRQVTLHWRKGEPSTHIVSESDFAKFLEATLELHHDPGINPHNGGETSRVVKITSRSLRPDGPFWWTVPGLKENFDPKGAKIWMWTLNEETVWEES